MTWANAGTQCPQDTADVAVLHLAEDTLRKSPARTPQEIEALLEEVRPLIKAYARRVLKTKGYLDARALDFDDHVQELELKVLRGLVSWDPQKSKLTTWVTAILLNRIRDFAKANIPAAKTSGKNVTDPETGFSLIDLEPGKGPGPSAVAEQSEWREALTRGLAELNPQEARAVRAYYLEGKTAREIGTQEGVGRAQINRRIREALVKLRHHLRSFDPESRASDLDPENANSR